MFAPNTNTQLTFDDSTLGLTERELKALRNSWAQVFRDEIFPYIDEELFSVLYSDAYSRPNTPVNVTVGALLIKELLHLSDDEVVERLMFDVQFQYALHTTSFKEQPLSDKTLSRFRKRCYEYEQETGRDLIHECIAKLGRRIADLMGITQRIVRMDSMMIEANIRKLTRSELIYSCVARMVTRCHKDDRDDLIAGMEHYYDPDDFNRCFYHATGEEVRELLKAILKDAAKLLEVCEAGYSECEPYRLLRRCINEQTVEEDGALRLRTKEDGGFDSRTMQNGTDPEATFRKKSGKVCRGYVGNVVEAVGEHGTAIIDWQLGQNIKSDGQCLQESIANMPEQEEERIIVADGAYGGKKNRDLAASKNIRLVTTGINGGRVNDILADFEFNEDGTQVLKCPAGHAPKSCCYLKTNGCCQLSFDRNQCAGCPHKDECKAKICKEVSRVTVSIMGHENAIQQRLMETEECKQLTRLRNGIETVMSVLRRFYHVDTMPVRRLLPVRLFFGCKIGAFNCKKLFAFMRGGGHYAQNPLLAGI